VREVVAAASSEFPPHGTDDSAVFDLGGVQPAGRRIEAAAAIVDLIAVRPSSELVARWCQLTRDPVTSVRVNACQGLREVHAFDPDSALAVLRERLDLERSGIVRQIVASRVGGLLEPSEIVDRLVPSLESGWVGPTGTDPSEVYITELLAVCVWDDEPRARGVLQELASNPDDPRADHLNHFTRQLGRWAGGDSQALEATRRLVQLLTRLARTAHARFRTEPSEQLARILDNLTTDLYFASGAYEEKQARDEQTSHQGTKLSEAERRCFYVETAGLLEELARVPIQPVSHHVLETLEYLVPLEPRAALERIRDLLLHAREGGYQFDSFACGTVVRIAEQHYLGERMFLLRTSQDARALLLDILDTFVDVGWPKIYNLLSRLDDILR
jgi:hypothetical protein